MAYSRWSDAVANAVLDKMLGSGADTSLLGTTLYAEIDTTGPSDANGTGIVASSLGRVAVSTTDGTMWPAASSRTKTNGSTVTFSANSSGSTINAVYVSFWSASTSGTFKGGYVLTGSPVAIPNGSTPTLNSGGGITVNSPGT